MGLVNKAKRTFQKRGKISALYETLNIYAKRDQNNTMLKHQQGGGMGILPVVYGYKNK